MDSIFNVQWFWWGGTLFVKLKRVVVVFFWFNGFKNHPLDRNRSHQIVRKETTRKLLCDNYMNLFDFSGLNFLSKKCWCRFLENYRLFYPSNWCWGKGWCAMIKSMVMGVVFGVGLGAFFGVLPNTTKTADAFICKRCSDDGKRCQTAGPGFNGPIADACFDNGGTACLLVNTSFRCGSI